MAEKIIDAYGNEVITKENSFVLCQSDVKISDTKFESKTTTFMKDAFRRFCKNKSSVVGAIIIGLLILLSLIVPIVSPFSMEREDSSIKNLSPKLFNSKNNTFWNGLDLKTGITWDFENDKPAEIDARGVVKIVKTEDILSNQANQFAGGGVWIITSEVRLGESVRDYVYTQNYTAFDINTTDNYKVVIDMEEDSVFENYKQAEYRILLTYNDNHDSIVLKDWSNDYGTVEDVFEYNLSDIIGDNGLTEVTKARVRFEAKLDAERLIFFGVKDCRFSCDSEDEEVNKLLHEISINDASRLVTMAKDPSTNKFPVEYWQATGIKKVNKLVVRKVDFLYDAYEVTLGNIDKWVAESDLNNYIRNGWCEYDFEVGPESFKKLSDKCPINKIEEQRSDELEGLGTLRYVYGEVTIYREKGYNRMPKFLFGTDGSGFDLVTRCFTYLLRSLALALCTSAFCFIFGLCWGSISGYFGGNVDLFMERFCDILAAVPGVVVLTLTILILDEKGVDKTVELGIAICLTGWMGVSGRTRTQFYRFKGREYILASRTLGASDMRLIFRHILPNAIGTIITSSVLMIPSVIFSEASLSYIGLINGMKSFGTILSTNQQYISTYPFLIIIPATIISLIMISFNLFGNGLRDAFNPSLKGSE